MHTRYLQILLIAITAVFTALTGAFYDDHAAYAQGSDDDYVDVGLTLEVPDTLDGGFTHSVNVVVENNGARPAYDVEVVLEVKSPEKSHFRAQTSPPVGSVSLGDDVPWDEKGVGRSLRWTIPELAGKQVEVFTAVVAIRNASIGGVTTYPAPTPEYDNRLYVHEFSGRVTTSSFESNLRKENNTSRVWSYVSSSTILYEWSQLLGNYTVKVSVDNPSPSPGETAKFTITGGVMRTGGDVGVTTALTPPPVDQKVYIELTDGLAIDSTGTISYGPAGTTGLSYSNGVFNIGTRRAREQSTTAEITHSVTLPVRVKSNAAVNEQCLTATVTGNPPPGPSPYSDDITDNVVEICLGQLSNPLLSSQVDELTTYLCVGNTDPPCDSTDDVRLRAVSDGDALGPGRTLIHAPAKANRRYYSGASSVNAGTEVSWQIPVTWDASELDAVHTEWSNLRDGFTAIGSNGGSPPGKISVIRWADPVEKTTEVLGYKLTPDTTPPWTAEFAAGYNPVEGANGPADITAEFEKLGTYRLDYTLKLTRATLDGDEDCDPNTDDPPVNQSFCATETYTFHLGPMAELEVRDGGASSHVPANRDALTIVAANNGPDEPSGGARITGLPTEAEVIHISHGSYNSSTGVWSIDRLRLRSYYRSAGMSEPTLVLGASAGDSASVKIASAKNYEVCVGPKDNPGDLDHTTQAACEDVMDASWNSVPVYDYKPHNNSATVYAAAGTGSALPAMPVTEAITAIRLTWAPVTEVNGRQVTHYDVQRRTNPWETVAKVLDPVFHDLVDAPDADAEPVTVEYLDWNVELGDIHEYRIRAVNDQDYSGPWSSSVEGTVPLPPEPPEPPEPPAVVKPAITEPIRILRIEPSINDLSLRGGDLIQLSVEVYGRQDLRDDSLGDRSDVTFDWTLEEFGMRPGGTVGRLVGPEGSNNDRARTSTLDGRRVLYIAPDSPGRFRITVSLEPGTECLPKRDFETEEEAQGRCTAVFEVTALRSSQIETATLDPRNPEGEIPLVLADSDGLQYEVFTPVSGGAFVHESASLAAGAGAVPDYEMIGLRISEVGPVSNEGLAYGRYTLGGDWYAIGAVDADGVRVEGSYEFNDVLDVCVPLPAELRSNISDLALVAVNSEDEITVLSSRVRLSTSGTKVCGHLSTVPASVSVGTAGDIAPRPVPTAMPEAPEGTGSPDTGGMTLPSVAVAFWMAVIGLTVVVAVLGFFVLRRRERERT